MKRGSLLSNKRMIVIFIILVILVISAFYFSFLTPIECEDIECFQEAMKKCESAVYLNEGESATWNYEVVDEEDRICVVEVTLMQAKEGELGVDKFEGYSMECDYPIGMFAYPEKDLDRCHGRLKEELQGVMIEKLHAYIIENLGTIDEKLKTF